MLTANEGAAGEMTIEVRFPAAELTVSVAVPFTVPDLAVMVTDPDADAVATPPAEMLATFESEDPH